MAEKKRPPTSGTRHGNGVGRGGPAKGAGWGGPAQGNNVKPKLTAEERSALSTEMIDLYVTISRDEAQPVALRLHAASHLLERLDNPFMWWN